jgi:hypothetical protein
MREEDIFHQALAQSSPEGRAVYLEQACAGDPALLASVEALLRANLARRRFYAAQLNLAMQAWHAGELPRVLELLESQRPRAGQDDLRGFEWY